MKKEIKSRGMTIKGKYVFIDLDKFLNRTEFKKGTISGKIFKIDKEQYQDIFYEKNKYNATKLDLLLSLAESGKLGNGVFISNGGEVVK